MHHYWHSSELVPRNFYLQVCNERYWMHYLRVMVAFYGVIEGSGYNTQELYSKWDLHIQDSMKNVNALAVSGSFRLHCLSLFILSESISLSEPPQMGLFAVFSTPNKMAWWMPTDSNSHFCLAPPGFAWLEQQRHCAFHLYKSKCQIRPLPGGVLQAKLQLDPPEIVGKASDLAWNQL